MSEEQELMRAEKKFNRATRGFVNLEGKFFASSSQTSDYDDDWFVDPIDEQAVDLHNAMVDRLDKIFNRVKIVSFSTITKTIPIPNETEWFFDYELARRGNWVLDAQRFKDRARRLEALLFAPGANRVRE